MKRSPIVNGRGRRRAGLSFGVWLGGALAILAAWGGFASQDRASQAAPPQPAQVNNPSGQANNLPTQAKNQPATAKKATAPADKNRVFNYTFDDLKFDIEKDSPFERGMLPKKIEDYAGQRVSIRGFILPTSFQTGLTNFILVRDNMECCFGPGAALYDCIVIEMAKGKTTDYSIRPVTVEGKFAIDEFIGPDRRHLAIYKIVADKVE